MLDRAFYRAPLFRQPPQLIPERLTSKPVSASRKARSSSHSSPPRLQRLPPDFSKRLCHHSLSRSETTPVNLTPAFTPPNRAVKSSPHHHVLCDPPPNFNHPPRIFVATTASNFSRAGSSPFAHLAPSVHPPPPPRQAGSARRDPPAPLRSVPFRARVGGTGWAWEREVFKSERAKWVRGIGLGSSSPAAKLLKPRRGSFLLRDLPPAAPTHHPSVSRSAPACLPPLLNNGSTGAVPVQSPLPRQVRLLPLRPRARRHAPPPARAEVEVFDSWRVVSRVGLCRRGEPERKEMDMPRPPQLAGVSPAAVYFSSGGGVCADVD